MVGSSNEITSVLDDLTPVLQKDFGTYPPLLDGESQCHRFVPFKRGV